MFSSLRLQLKYSAGIISAFLLLTMQPAHAAGSPETSIYSNPVAIALLSLMIVLLIVIGFLANILIGTAQLKVTKEKKKPATEKIAAAAAVVLFMLASSNVFAQPDMNSSTSSTPSSVSGLPVFTFYVMMSVIFLELLVILVLLMNVRVLLKKEKLKLITEPEVAVIHKRVVYAWWSRFNRFKPVEQEADIDLGHDYDGIRELDNRLPPWWLYGFYITIIAAGIYLWRYHVSHTGPTSIQEYDNAVAAADIEIKEYLKMKGESVDENTVTVLVTKDALSAGKAIFTKSCIACHKETGGGDVGPNLTDNYWLHGGDIKNIFKTIRYGINAMPQWQNAYSNKEIAEVASYVKSLKGTNPPDAKAPQGELYKDDPAPAKQSQDSTAKDNKTVMNN